MWDWREVFSLAGQDNPVCGGTAKFIAKELKSPEGIFGESAGTPSERGIL